MFQKIITTVAKHKIATTLAVVLVLGGGYALYSSGTSANAQTRYVLGVVEKGTLISSISGSGQVSASNQVDVKAKGSGDVIYVGIKNGQEVRAGAVLAQLNTNNAQKAIRDAQLNLENAQITLSKLQISQQSTAPKLQDTITSAQNNLDQAYQNGFNAVGNAFLDLPTILTGIRGVLYDTTVGTPGQPNSGAYKDLMDQYGVFTVIAMTNQAVTDYQSATEKYNANLIDYNTNGRTSTPDQIVALIGKTLDTAKALGQAVKDEQNLLDTVVASIKQYQPNRTIPAAIIQYQSTIASSIGNLNGHITSLTNIQSSITSSNQSLASAQRDITSTQQSNPLDLASQENALRQRQSALQDAKEALADYVIRAPFAGVITKATVKRGDSISSGTAIATLLAKQRIAEITLNEIDIAKVKVGQKATLTFDAVPDTTLTGQVLDVDALGTVTQGVVTYAVQIGFDAQDDRVKPGMSVSASIITDVQQDVLMVPSSAVKSAGGSSYVQVPSDLAAANQLMANATSAGILLPAVPSQQTIQVGSTNDTMVEVTSGLKEGDVIVTRTIVASSTTSQASTQTRSLLPTGGRAAGAGGTFRATGR